MTIRGSAQRIADHLAATFDQTPREHIVDVVESYAVSVGRGGSDDERRLLVEFLSRDRLWAERCRTHAASDMSPSAPGSPTAW